MILKPITIFFGGAKSWKQQQCPCKIVDKDNKRGEELTQFHYFFWCRINKLNNILANQTTIIELFTIYEYIYVVYL